MKLASVEGVDGLLLLEDDLPLVTTKASIVLTDGEIEMRFSPPEIETFGLSDSNFEMSFSGSNVTDFASIAVPSKTENGWGPGDSNVVMPFPPIESVGEFEGQPFNVSFDASDIELSVDDILMFDGNLVGRFKQQSQYDQGLRLQEFLLPNEQQTAFPDNAELLVNYWFELEDGFREVNFDYSNVVFQETEIGDANSDGRVDLTDFFILSFNFGSVGDTTWEQGDFDEDGIIEFKDFLVLAYNYDGAPAASAVAVPEPDFFLVTPLLLLTCMQLRRKSII